MFWELLRSVKGLACNEVLCWLAGKVKINDFEWFCLFLWGLWGNRNVRIHRLKVRDVDQLITWVSGLFVEFQSSVSISVPPR
ncbi:hypothetical protein ACOSQ2_009333 [Xanthoceras sorbifolium]